MNEGRDSRRQGKRTALGGEIERKTRRRIKAQKQADRGIWYGFGMFGLVGWAVAVPSVAGIALGVWLDHRWPSRYSWTITGLTVGVAVGCVHAWYWMKKEGGKDD